MRGSIAYWARARNDPAPALHAGDVVSFGIYAPGHTDVVIATHLDRAGNGTITTLNQNLGLGIGRPIVLTLKVKRWNFSVYGLRATGWLHWTP